MRGWELLVVSVMWLQSAGCRRIIGCDRDTPSGPCLEDEDYEYNPTPTPVPSLALLVTGTHGGANAGMQVHLIVAGWPHWYDGVLCGGSTLGTAGTFAVESNGAVLVEETNYALDLLLDSDDDGVWEVDQGEHPYELMFQAPSVGTSLTVVFDFAIETPYKSSLGPWEADSDYPVTCP